MKSKCQRLKKKEVSKFYISWLYYVISIEVLIEKRFKEQTENLRKDLQTSMQETGRLSAFSEKLSRGENELKNQLEEKEKVVCQVSIVKALI